MERDICIGGVEFSNPYRTWAYMRNAPNSCMADPGVAPCQCEGTACDDSPLFTLSAATFGESTWATGIGAEIMGRNKFGPQRGPWTDHEWTGWWGDTPPFHTPVFVLTHHERPSITLADTTFHFLDASPVEAVERAKVAAG